MRIPRRVLVLEGDEVALAGLLELLRNASYEVTGVTTFDAAQRLLEVEAYDLLVTDVRLRAFNGLQLVQRVRPEHPGMAIIVITGYPSPLVEMEATRHGAICLYKPLNADLLLNAVGRALDSVRYKRRWPRKEIVKGLTVMTGERTVTVRNICYGGVRLELEGSSARLPDVLRLELPVLNLSVRVAPVWTTYDPDGNAVHCGAALLADTPRASRAWRSLVDTIHTSTN